jgi:hypothetical protein
LHFAGNPLIGTGFDSFWLGARLERIWAAGGALNGINESHNGYIETYLNLGWIGVALLAALILTGYWNVIRGLKTDGDVGRLRLGLLVVAVVYNFTEAGFRTTCTVWVGFLLAVVAAPALAGPRKPRFAVQENRIEPEPDPEPRTLVSAAARERARKTADLEPVFEDDHSRLISPAELPGIGKPGARPGARPLRFPAEG